MSGNDLNSDKYSTIISTYIVKTSLAHQKHNRFTLLGTRTRSIKPVVLRQTIQTLNRAIRHRSNLSTIYGIEKRHALAKVQCRSYATFHLAQRSRVHAVEIACQRFIIVLALAMLRPQIGHRITGHRPVNHKQSIANRLHGGEFEAILEHVRRVQFVMNELPEPRQKDEC